MTVPQYASAEFLAQNSAHPSLLQGKSLGDQNAALATASRVADSYLRQRYAVPLESWEDDLRRVVCDIAAYDLAGQKAHGVDGRTTLVRVRYEDAVKWLKAVASGAASLAGPEHDDPELDEGWGVGVASDPERGW